MRKTLQILSFNFEHLREEKLNRHLETVLRLLLPYDVVFLFEHKITSFDLGARLAELLSSEEAQKIEFQSFLNKHGEFTSPPKAQWRHGSIAVGQNEYVLCLWRTRIDRFLELDVMLNRPVHETLQEAFAVLASSQEVQSGEKDDPLLKDGKLTIRYPAAVSILLNGHRVLDVLAWHAPRPNRQLSLFLMEQILRALGTAGQTVDLLLGDMNVEPDFDEPDDTFTLRERKREVRATRSSTKGKGSAKSPGFKMSLAPMYVPSKRTSTTFSKDPSTKERTSFDSARLRPIDFGWVRPEVADRVTCELTSHLSGRMTHVMSDHRPVRFTYLLEQTLQYLSKPLTDSAQNLKKAPRFDKLPSTFSVELLGITGKKSPAGLVLRGFGDASDAWYSDDDISELINHHLDDDDHVYVMRGIDLELHSGQALQLNLQQALQNMATLQPGAHTLIAPVHIHGNHWTALHIRFQGPGRTNPQILYVDPLSAGEPPRALYEVLASVLGNAVPLRYSLVRYQTDTYNCGAWVVALLVHLVEHNGALPSAQALDIHALREEYDAIVGDGDDDDEEEDDDDGKGESMDEEDG